jgi:flavin-dependent dehydrogenase
VKAGAKGSRLAIAGAGITGAYLFRLLKNAGYEVDLFERRRRRTRCGIKPCAWGTSRGFVELVEQAGLKAEDYILQRVDHVIMDDVTIKADLMTFDKPRLVKDLLRDAEIHFTPLPVQSYARVIDATGVSRALLPSIEDDILLTCRQYLVETGEPLENRIKLGGIGYAWCFPLSPSLYHAGCGSLLADPEAVLRKLGWLRSASSPYPRKVVCRCTAKIRLTGPHRSQPFVSDGCEEGIWGVGEAIGCVAPLAGDGVVPGMRNVQLLLSTWDNPDAYTEAVLAEFRWMRDERGVIDKLRSSEGVGIREAYVLRRNSKRMGMQVRLRDAVALMKNLR